MTLEDKLGKDNKRIVILGGGFAGLEFAKRINSEDAEIVLIDRENHHLFQPLLYQVAMAGLSAPDVAQPLRAILSKKPNLTVVMDEVTGIDLDGRRVHLSEESLAYDYLALGLGSRTNYFGNDHWAEHAPGLKSLEDARRIRNNILAAFERAEVSTDPEEIRRLQTIVVVGGGPTGVELAGSCSELARHTLKRDFRHIDPAKTRVILVEALPRVLPSFSEASGRKALEHLKELGVEVQLESMVKDVSPGRLDLGDKGVIEAENIIWGTGVTPVPVVKELDVPQDKAGRIKVEPDLTVPGYPEVYVIGDTIHLSDARDRPVPGLAPAAQQTGRHAAKMLNRKLAGEPNDKEAFVYFDKGNMATIGRSKAITETFWGIKFSGFLAWVGWLFIHLIFLVGLRNRLSVFLNWVFNYVTYGTSARLIWGRQKHDTGALVKPSERPMRTDPEAGFEEKKRQREEVAVEKQ